MSHIHLLESDIYLEDHWCPKGEFVPEIRIRISNIYSKHWDMFFYSRLLAYRVDSNSVEIVKKVIIILEVEIHFPILSERAGSSISPIWRVVSFLILIYQVNVDLSKGVNDEYQDRDSRHSHYQIAGGSSGSFLYCHLGRFIDRKRLPGKCWFWNLGNSFNFFFWCDTRLLLDHWFGYLWHRNWFFGFIEVRLFSLNFWWSLLFAFSTLSFLNSDDIPNFFAFFSLTNFWLFLYYWGTSRADFIDLSIAKISFTS